jgi:hypothetical protein
MFWKVMRKFLQRVNLWKKIREWAEEWETIVTWVSGLLAEEGRLWGIPEGWNQLDLVRRVQGGGSCWSDWGNEELWVGDDAFAVLKFPKLPSTETLPWTLCKKYILEAYHRPWSQNVQRKGLGNLLFKSPFSDSYHQLSLGFLQGSSGTVGPWDQQLPLYYSSELAWPKVGFVGWMIWSSNPD